MPHFVDCPLDVLVSCFFLIKFMSVASLTFLPKSMLMLPVGKLEVLFQILCLSDTVLAVPPNSVGQGQPQGAHCLPQPREAAGAAVGAASWELVWYYSEGRFIQL